MNGGKRPLPDPACCTRSAAAPMSLDVATDLAGVFKALADPLRLRMLSAVAADPRGECCVCDLADLGEVSQPTISHHLRVLREAGLVEAERRGTWVWYRLARGSEAQVTMLLRSRVPSSPPAVERTPV